MSPTSRARATALFAALAFAPPVRAQDPIPLPLPAPAARPDSRAEARDSRVAVLEKGPIHEGFAQPGAQTRGKGVTAPKAPPAPVEEVPPTPKPEGAKWVPGYWQWDADKSDFIWVCGCYRTAPPDRSWEPGRWKEMNRRWTYFPGYWRPADGKGVLTRVPEPPASRDDGPVAPNDNPNAMWVPGIWEHKNGKFEWQPGYWPPSSGNMVWQQAQYVLAETGFVFVPGHWDYPIEARGVLYTPIYFTQALRDKRGWAYRPEYTISFGSDAKWGQGGAFDALSIGPNYNSYFYGDSSLRTVNVQFPGEFPMWDFLSGIAGPLVEGDSGASRPWDSVSPGYTNPLWQNYVRLNRKDSGLAKGTAAPSDATRTTGRANPLAFVEPGLGCRSLSGCTPAPHVHWVPTPVVHGGHYHRR